MKGSWAGQVRPGNGGWQQKQTELKTPPPLNAYSQPCVRKMFFHFFNSSASRKPHLPEFCTWPDQEAQQLYVWDHSWGFRQIHSMHNTLNFQTHNCTVLLKRMQWNSGFISAQKKVLSSSPRQVYFLAGQVTFKAYRGFPLTRASSVGNKGTSSLFRARGYPTPFLWSAIGAFSFYSLLILITHP